MSFCSSVLSYSGLEYYNFKPATKAPDTRVMKASAFEDIAHLRRLKINKMSLLTMIREKVGIGWIKSSESSCDGIVCTVYWKYYFPVRTLMFACSILGRLERRENTLPCSYRSTCFIHAYLAICGVTLLGLNSRAGFKIP